MIFVVLLFLSVLNIKGDQPVTLDYVTAKHSVDKGTLQLGQITLGFSEKPNISIAESMLPQVRQKQIQLACANTAYTGVSQKSACIHTSIPYNFQVIPSLMGKNEVRFIMQFDPRTVHVVIDEYVDTPEGVSLVIRVYDHNWLRRLDHHTISILQVT